ncbi:MAG: phage tail protein [Campylobacteraceae bacterium]|jgi:hypothetical protein|nr:phage tail protein [Campylobacteraceae bacterium]
MSYEMILTTIGQQKIAEMTANQGQLQLSSIALGDGEITPNPSMTNITNEVYRTSISALYRHPTNNSVAVAEGYIPLDVGGFYIREIGVYDTDNNLIAVGNYPEQYKETMAEGSATDLKIKVMMLVGSTESVTLVPPPSGLFASAEALNAEVERAGAQEGVLLEGITANEAEIAQARQALSTYQNTMGAGTGFIDREQCEIIFSSDPYKMTIRAKDPERGFDIAFHGKIFTKYEDEITIDWTGNRYIIYTDDGAGLASAQYPDSLDHIIVAYVYFNPNSAEKYILAADERHQAARNPISHYLHHREFGATWLNGGSVNYHVAGEDDPQIHLADLGLSDEGLEFTIRHAATPYATAVAEEILEQKLRPLKAPVLYQDAFGVWASDAVSEYLSVKINQDGVPTYNNAGAADTQVELEDGQYISYWICSTNAKLYPIKVIQGNRAHNSEDECINDEFKSLGLPMPEIIAMWQIIYQYDTSIANGDNPYGIKLVSIRSPKRALVGGEQYFGNNTHEALAGRTLANQHPSEAIHDTSRNKPLPAVLSDIESEIARVAALSENGRNRGSVNNAFISQGQLFRISAATPNTAGTLYAVGDLIYIHSSKEHTPAVIRVLEVNGSGGVTSFVLVSGGSYDMGALDVVTSTTGVGTGFAANYTTLTYDKTTLNAITEPKPNDYAYVEQDELHALATWLYVWGDADGDGTYGWLPIVLVNSEIRDFTAQPIAEEEIAPPLSAKINGAVQSSQISANAPSSSSTVADITPASTLYSLFGGLVGSLATAAKTLIGAINELKSTITNLRFEDLSASDFKGRSAHGKNLATGAQIEVNLAGIRFFLRKGSTSQQFVFGLLNTASDAKAFVAHLEHQYSGTSQARYFNESTLSAGASVDIHNLINYGGDCAFTCYVTNVTDEKFYIVCGQGIGNNMRIFARQIY